MLSAQTNYHLTNKDSATVEFVSNMLQNEANNYLSNMNTLSHVSKMCSSLSAHWPPVGINMPNPAHPLNHLNHHHNQIAHLGQSASSSSQLAQNAAAAAALAAGHNIESILGSSYSVKIDNDKLLNKHEANLKNSDFNNSYDAGKNFLILSYCEF